MPYRSFVSRVSIGRRQFLALWHDGESPSRPRVRDRRAGARHRHARRHLLPALPPPARRSRRCPGTPARIMVKDLPRPDVENSSQPENPSARRGARAVGGTGVPIAARGRRGRSRGGAGSSSTSRSRSGCGR
jgi:hypothetical protein